MIFLEGHFRNVDNLLSLLSICFFFAALQFWWRLSDHTSWAGKVHAETAHAMPMSLLLVTWRISMSFFHLGFRTMKPKALAMFEDDIPAATMTPLAFGPFVFDNVNDMQFTWNQRILFQSHSVDIQYLENGISTSSGVNFGKRRRDKAVARTSKVRIVATSASECDHLEGLVFQQLNNHETNDKQNPRIIQPSWPQQQHSVFFLPGVGICTLPRYGRYRKEIPWPLSDSEFNLKLNHVKPHVCHVFCYVFCYVYLCITCTSDEI